MSMALGQGLFVRKETMIALTIERWIRWGHATSVRSGNVAMMLLKSEGKICPWHGAKTSLRKGTTVALTIESCFLWRNATSFPLRHEVMMPLKTEDKICP